ncbi:hypothetical protein H4O09_08075 [Stenotrophomonas sp. W1S232]|uniref:Anti sigma-E protein RseA N-terminal domain-containing protein n=1 Tax=Stenotrophomonas koreensis TaxID=266128 RepID=A0A7W3YVL3_9GAMM|nr:RseA family anti-sigma factor [Stenotrophomonas koreensis]MBB1117004.1 hypothetical protein [Stenotrophomonas koreensis]
MNPNSPDHDPALQRVDALHRQQLSALIDGELSADQARFLIRRLEHDQELSACQERWQIAGDVLRGQLGAVAPADFAARVALALPPVVALPGTAADHRARPRRWVAGGALAACMALVAVLLLPGRAPVPAPSPLLVSGTAAPELPVKGAEPATAVAPAAAQAPPLQAAVAAATVAAPPEATESTLARRVRPAPLADAAAAPPMVAGQMPPDSVASPFALPVEPVHARPWPRSQLGRADAFNVRLPAAGSPFAPPRDAAASSHWQPVPQP